MVTSSPRFSQVFILKLVKVLCFDTLLQVLILKALHFEGAEAFLFHSQAVPGVEKRPMGQRRLRAALQIVLRAARLGAWAQISACNAGI